MTRVPLTSELRQEYERLWLSMEVRADRAMEVSGTAHKVLSGKRRYQEVAATVGCPWELVGVIHSLEGSLNWKTHLHNGDSLAARTVHVPAGRPAKGHPPFDWAESAVDALRLKGWHKLYEWSTASQLYRLEEYNGWGYRLYHAATLSPYLWAATTHYRAGKYIADGQWSARTVSRQIGAAPLLREIRRIDT